jgi:predicted NAD/FAD-binding protein
VKDILGFPASTFLSFCLNHRLLQIEDRPKWKTVVGGSREYVKAMVAQLSDTRLNCPVYKVERVGEQVVIRSAQGIEHFDAVIFACHAPTALALLGDASEHERDILKSFRYQPNKAILHLDTKLLPRRQKVWSAWNYMSSPGEGTHRPVAVSYLLNQLQPLPFKTPVIVTLNPNQEPNPDLVLRTFDYEHPVMNMEAEQAQRRLPEIQGLKRSWFCGAWSGYGFHEDGLKSALRVVRDFDVEIPWVPVYA